MTINRRKKDNKDRLLEETIKIKERAFEQAVALMAILGVLLIDKPAHIQQKVLKEIETKLGTNKEDLK